MDPIIIIGTGIAAYTLAREFRKLDSDTPLQLISSDDGCSYPKPMLSNALSKGKTAEQIVLFDAETMAKKLNAEIFSFTKIVAIDSESHALTTADGKVFNYSKLVLALGAHVIKIPFAGDASHDVLSVNDIIDYTIFRKKLTDAKHVTIIGPGLIGCEFANDLLNAGFEVSIIGPSEQPMDKLLPKEIAKELADRLSQLGADWHFKTTTKSINKAVNGYLVELENGITIETDLVLSAVGLRSHIELAEAAGLDVNRGVVTDSYLQTSAKDIYALGDCAEVSGHNLLFIAPITAASKSLAQTLSGSLTVVKYPAMPVTIKTPCYPLVVSPPSNDAQGAWNIEAVESGFGSSRALFTDKNKELLGFVLSGDAVSEKRSLAGQLADIL